MISALRFLARGQNVFFGWVILSEHKWVISRERRGVGELPELGRRQETVFLTDSDEGFRRIHWRILLSIKSVELSRKRQLDSGFRLNGRAVNTRRLAFFQLASMS